LNTQEVRLFSDLLMTDSEYEQYLKDTGKMNTFLKVKIKSLAAEAKIIRLEEKKAKARKNRDLIVNLREHRIHTVRKECRASHLAQGFLKGRPYKSMEAFCYQEPDWKKVQSMIERFGEGDKRELVQRFSEWKEA
jgi:hypothetical protein